MERLSLLDAEFLHLEDRSSPMHIACVSIFEGPAPKAEDVRKLLASKLHRIPRYRQRIRVLPFEVGRPVWVDDPHFDLAYHVRGTAIPSPGGDEELCALVGRVMSSTLDREKPLWESWVVESLADGRWALLSKVHHCMVDGVSGIDLLAVMLDFEQDAVVAAPVPWSPAPEPTSLEMVKDALTGLRDDAAGWVEKIRHGLEHPDEAKVAVLKTSEGLVTFAKRLAPTRALSIEGPIGTHRTYAHSNGSIADVKVIRKAFGGTLNDVVLAVIAGGYRALLLGRNEDVDHAVVRSLVPVSVRAPDAHGIPDNRVSALICDLPVHLADPVARLEAVKNQMSELKASNMAEAGEWVTDIGNLAPPMLVGPITRLVARLMHQLPQRSLNTVTTNVPGPPVPLYCLGRRMLASYPYVPIYQGLRTGIAILSYAGTLSFGITGDYDHAPDVATLADGIAADLAELRRLADAASRESTRTP